MMAPMIVRPRLVRVIFFLVVLTLTPLHAAEVKPAPVVVASIAPIHSLLSSLLQNIAEPRLLLDASQSAHHFSLRPSQRSTLTHADIVFWVGEDMEAFLPRVFRSLPRDVKTVALMQTPGLTKLSTREDPLEHAEESHNHSQHEHQSLESHHAHHGNYDPHIWLSIDNAIAMSRYMAEQLTRIDPDNRDSYHRNLQQLVQRLEIFKKKTTQQISHRTLNYLVYHDAYQYFENSFKLAPLAAISLDEEQAPGIKRLRRINQLLKQNNISCILFNTTTRPTVINSLNKADQLPAFFVQPLGQYLPAGSEQYFLLMTQLRDAFLQCSH